MFYYYTKYLRNLINYIKLFQRRILMTLVFRAARQLKIIANDNPGPGSYQFSKQKVQKFHNSSVFLSKVERNTLLNGQNEKELGCYFKKSQETQYKQLQCRPLKSRMEQFQTNCEETSMKFTKQFNDLMKGNQNDKTHGKIMGIKQKRQFENTRQNTQHLPSIPNSYSQGKGYDNRTTQLINNPKIIFAQAIKLDKNSDYYFQRLNHSQDSKQYLIGIKSKRNDADLAHQLNTSITGKYCTESQTISQKNKNIITNNGTKQFRLPSNLPSKQLILMNKHKEQSITKKQCFQSSIQRFKINTIHQKPPSLTESNQILNRDTTYRNSFSNFNMYRKQTFAKGEKRFRQQSKQNLGPGSFIFGQQAKTANKFNLTQKQDRLKEFNKPITPGPGSYEISGNIQNNKNLRVNFNKFRNTCYQVAQVKLNSMQNLQQKAGLHVDYLTKMEKSDSFKSNKEDRGKIVQSKGLQISKFRQTLKIKLGLNCQNQHKDQRKRSEFKNIRFQHLYSYNKPQEKSNGVGPGHYQIRTTLDKKSFNKTANQ